MNKKTCISVGLVLGGLWLLSKVFINKTMKSLEIDFESTYDEDKEDYL